MASEDQEGAAEAGEMELDFAAGGRGEGGGGQAGDLAEEFFQGCFIFRSDVFGGDVFCIAGGGGLAFAEEFLGEASAGSGGQPQGHLTMNGASGNDRIPNVGIGGRQGSGNNFEDGGFSGRSSGNL